MAQSAAALTAAEEAMISDEDRKVFELFALRDYQIRAILRIRELIRAGYKNILVCAPTGAGKTRLAAAIIYLSKNKCTRSAFVVDRVNLVDQTSETLDQYGIEHGVMQSTHWRYRPYEKVQVCSSQTLARRGQWPESHLIVVDECHTVTKVTKSRLEKRDTTALGLTATPFTKGLGKLYDALVNVATTNELIASGALAKFRIFAASEPDMEGVKLAKNGEWDAEDSSKRAMEVVGDCVAEYLKHGSGKKFICSAVDVAHVEALHKQFLAAGVMCEMYTYKVNDDERAAIVKEFRKADSYIRGLITVTAASKGFDVPDIGVVIMARPLRKSLAEHIQFFGRGLRSYPGKEECIVLDHSGNSTRFWDEWNEFFETGALELDDGRKKEKTTKLENLEERMVKCGNCKHLHKPMPFCPACGHEYPKREAVKHVAGTLQELVASGDRKAMTAELWPQVVGYARRKREGDPARKLALALFKKMTGQWPSAEFEKTESQPITKDVANKIKQLNIAYAKSKVTQSMAQSASGGAPW